LSQGSKGVAELREAVEQYYNGDDVEVTTAAAKGPLFGMIDFRRRKVLIKLVPDDTSRLVKGESRPNRIARGRRIGWLGRDS
jgi:hypothetical protein